ncbi:MAG: ThiF family adenylyltransferase [Tepidisphaeraceae bacterium]
MKPLDGQVMQITPEDGRPAEADDRFDRFRLIGWWDQRKLAAAKVLVVGAGALGNEIIKNLALLGVGNILIADKDRIEHSNLSRSVLYRAADAGLPKAQVAARAAKDIYPDLNVHFFDGDVVHDLGMGVFRWADVIIGGLDNREARLAINRNCWKVNRPWIDGAIEQIDGTARVFIPGDHDAPCYECTMSEQDWKLLQMRRSCNLLTRAEMERGGGKTPTTPTISSVIAGVQCQEAIKLIHGLETIGGRGWVFSGLATDAYQTTFQRKADCYSHDTLDEVIELDEGAATLTPRDLLRKARSLLGPAARVELSRDVLEKLACPACGEEELLFVSLGKVHADKALCPRCTGSVRRDVTTFDTIRGNEAFLDRTLADIGVPPFDIIIVRGKTTDGERAIGLELSADAPAVLGSLVQEEGLQWD